MSPDENTSDPATFVRPQYHFRRTPTGLDAWDVRRLIVLSRALPVVEIDPSTIVELDSNHWFSNGSDKPTPRRIVEHVRLIRACDLAWPIILDSQGRLMDGMHRVCRAILDGRARIQAVQFAVDPEADFRNCDPASLPYDDWPESLPD